MKIKRGDIFWSDLSPAIGAESGGLRCIVVLQSDELNDEVSLNGGTVTVAPIISRAMKVGANTSKAILPVNISELSLFRDYQILLFQPRAIDVRRLKERVGRLSPETMAEVDKKLSFAMGLDSLASSSKSPCAEDSAGKRDYDLEREAASILHRLGVPADIPGYLYLRTAIAMVAKNFDLIRDIQALYSDIADQYSVTAEQVDNAIHEAIELSWDRGDVGVLFEYFSYTVQSDTSFPTNSEYIAIIAERVESKNNI